MQSTKIKEHKFSSLLSFLQENYPKEAALQTKLQQATAIGEVWVLLFKYGLFDLYHTLMQEGVLRILATEIQHPHPTYGYIWFWLSQTKEGRRLFLHLLHQDIQPTQEQLVHTPHKAYSTWYYLIQQDTCGLLEYLLQKNIYPTTDDLSKTIRESGLTLWSVLAKNHIDYFHALLKKNILPSAALLSQSKDRQKIPNGWLKLLQNLSARPSSSEPFLYLIQQGILPSAEDLAVEYCPHIDTNTGWSFLIHSLDKSSEIMLAILQNLLPTPKILSRPLVTFNEEGSYLQNYNHWYYLANLQHGPEIFYALLDKEILPDSTDLANPNIWKDLVKTTKGIHCLQRLLKRNILPSSIHLYSQDEKSSWSIWAVLLTKPPQRAEDTLLERVYRENTFLELLYKGILPSSQTLELRHQSSSLQYINSTDLSGDMHIKEVENSEITNFAEPSWKTIFDKNNTRVWEHLCKHHILPPLYLAQQYNNLRIFQLLQLQSLSQTYQIQGTHVIVSLLSHPKFSSYYGALYFLYRQIHDYPHFHFLEIFSTAFSAEISSVFATLKQVDFYLPENRETFAKYYIMTELNNYLQRRICTHKERALSLQQALYDSKDPASIIVNQLLMLERGNSPYPSEQKEKYKTPLQGRYIKGEFHRILRDGFFLCAHRKIEANMPESLEENWTNIESEDTSISMGQVQ